MQVEHTKNHTFGIFQISTRVLPCRNEKFCNIMSELDHLCSLVRDIPQNDLKATNVQVEDTNTHTFGISYVPHYNRARYNRIIFGQILPISTRVLPCRNGEIWAIWAILSILLPIGKSLRATGEMMLL